MKAYPIKFEPILKEKIWGGSKLKSLLNKNTQSDQVGESWEISGVDGSVSKVKNGRYQGMSITQLGTAFKEEFLGTENYHNFGNQFPLLIKFLDASTNLSVQVHPGDEMAKREHNSFGKTEMWYIMDHDKDAEIIVGLNNETTSTEALATVNKDNVYDIFNAQKVAKGDTYFIPAGEVHAIGAGVLAAEIQQTSDITYRVYDWDRCDANGNGRELHIDKAIRATNTSPNSIKNSSNGLTNQSTAVVKCDYFTTNKLNVSESYKKDYSSLDSFVILMCTEGTATVTTNNITEVVTKGTTILLPATTDQTYFFSEGAQFLEVYIGDYAIPKSSSAFDKRRLAVAS
jgi:mannose-6-phosphate isomerase